MVGDFLRKSINHRVDPCDDFYRHVCNEHTSRAIPYYEPLEAIKWTVDPEDPYLSISRLRSRRSLFYDSLKIQLDPALVAEKKDARALLYIHNFAKAFVTIVQFPTEVAEENFSGIKARLTPLGMRNKHRLDDLKRRMFKSVRETLGPTARFPDYEKMKLRIEGAINETSLFFVLADDSVEEAKKLHESFKTYINTVYKPFLSKYQFDHRSFPDWFFTHWYVGEPFGKNLVKDYLMRLFYEAGAAAAKEQYAAYFKEYVLPFILDADIDDGILYGSLAAVVGHEMFHTTAFVNDSYDLNFNDIDSHFYNCSVQMHENSCRIWGEGPCFSGKRTNIANTEEEDAADFFGMRAASKAFFELLAEDKTTDRGKQMLYPDLRMTREQAFFYANAAFYCAPFEAEQHLVWVGSLLAAASQTHPKRGNYDVHSAARPRTNIAFANTPEFAAAFNCNAGDRMVQRPTCKIL